MNGRKFMQVIYDRTHVLPVGMYRMGVRTCYAKFRQSTCR